MIDFLKENLEILDEIDNKISNRVNQSMEPISVTISDKRLDNFELIEMFKQKKLEMKQLLNQMSEGGNEFINTNADSIKTNITSGYFMRYKLLLEMNMNTEAIMCINKTIQINPHFLQKVSRPRIR